MDSSTEFFRWILLLNSSTEFFRRIPQFKYENLNMKIQRLKNMNSSTTQKNSNSNELKISL
jgi:hypothetical protein